MVPSDTRKLHWLAYSLDNVMNSDSQGVPSSLPTRKGRQVCVYMI